MGKGGGKGGGGGSSKAPDVEIPSGLYQTTASIAGIGQYGTSLLDSIGGMTNWAANLASGGHGGAIPSFNAVATQQGPQTVIGRRAYHTAFDPRTGEITFTDPEHPSRTFQRSITQPENLGDMPDVIKQQWAADYANNQAFMAGGGGGGGGGVGTSNLASQGVQHVTQPDWTKKFWNEGQWEQFTDANASGRLAMAQQAGVSPEQFDLLNQVANTGGSNIYSQENMGPFLSSAWNAIQAQESLPGQMGPVEAQTASLAQEATTEASTLMQQATGGTGLFPSQEALVEQARNQGETSQAAMLAKLGLSESTMGPALKEQADLSAAATAGQLVQGNIQLAQAAQKIALGAQGLETAEIQAVADMYGSIATQSEQFQKTLWDEALAGYGVLGSILSGSAQAYGENIGAFQAIIQGEAAHAQAQAGIDEAKIQSSSQSSSSGIAAIGSIIGAVVSLL